MPSIIEFLANLGPTSSPTTVHYFESNLQSHHSCTKNFDKISDKRNLLFNTLVAAALSSTLIPSSSVAINCYHRNYWENAGHYVYCSTEVFRKSCEKIRACWGTYISSRLWAAPITSSPSGQLYDLYSQREYAVPRRAFAHAPPIRRQNTSRR